MKKIVIPFLFLIASISGVAQLAEGKKNIEKLCGCFGVDFQYAETFSPRADYKFHDREHMGALELALPIEKTDKRISIQHLLVVDSGIIVKHWREDWDYELPFIWKYAGNKTWVKQNLKPEDYKGKWTQTIWEVDDAPRYQGVSEWLTTDSKTFWQNTADAPLPRREYSVRSDYNLLKRGNRLIITEQGYLHEQDNEKIIKAPSKEEVLAQEKGYNTYTLAADAKCESARQWWAAQASFWSVVRSEWLNVFNSRTMVSLQERVNEKSLSEHFRDLEEQWNSKKLSRADLSVKLNKVLQQFTADKNSVATK